MSQRAEEMPIPECFPLPMTVAGRTVVITGAGRGLGRVLAVAFARAHANVALVGRQAEDLKLVETSLPGEHMWIAGDVRDPALNEHVASAVRERYGHLDVWIANAGISPVVRRATEMEVDTWCSIVETNLTGVFLGARAAAKVMEPGGRIIMTSSVLSQRASVGLSAYSASKAGIEAFTRTLALELGPQQITVNAVAPGWFDSPLSAGFRDGDERERQILGHTALGQWGTADDLPGPYLFLASEASRFVTGAVIPLDGGYLLS
jgi:NAD(P)-dependent dehydrogenase (short-subunit alcohol dehydrogenase family)